MTQDQDGRLNLKMPKIAWVLTAWNMIRFILCNHSTWYKMKTLHWPKQRDRVVCLMSQTYAKSVQNTFKFWLKRHSLMPLKMELKQAWDSWLLIFTVAVVWQRSTAERFIRSKMVAKIWFFLCLYSYKHPSSQKYPVVIHSLLLNELISPRPESSQTQQNKNRPFNWKLLICKILN